MRLAGVIILLLAMSVFPAAVAMGQGQASPAAGQIAGATPPQAAAVSIPEPATVLLLGLGGAALIIRRRSR